MKTGPRDAAFKSSQNAMDSELLLKNSEATLSRVERNDATLEWLTLTSDHLDDDRATFWPADSGHLSRLGDAIGKNTHLQTLQIRSPPGLADQIMDNRALFNGLKRNVTVREFTWEGANFSEELLCQILSDLLVNMANLEEIALNMCYLGNGGAGAVASAVARCTNLNRLFVTNCDVTDDDSVEIIFGVRGMHQLHILGLEGNDIERAGCKALATLLEDPDCNLTHLDLEFNRIDDNCADILAASLKTNKELRELSLWRNQRITERGWEAFSGALCDRTSTNATYLSNHALSYVGGTDLPCELRSLFQQNYGDDKRQVAKRKILRHHSCLDMGPFLEWDLKMLPVVVGWFDSAEGHVENNGQTDVNPTKLFAIYQFARAKPMMFVPSPGNAATETLGSWWRDELRRWWHDESGAWLEGSMRERLFLLLLGLGLVGVRCGPLYLKTANEGG